MTNKAFALLWVSAWLLLSPGDTAAQTEGPEQEIRYSPRPISVEAMRTNLVSLNGTWLFNPTPSGNFWELKEKSTSGWAKIQVPGDWTMQGFSVAPNTAAAYWKMIEIPAEWEGCRIKLRCDGVQSDAKIRVNGRPARATK